MHSTFHSPAIAADGTFISQVMRAMIEDLLCSEFTGFIQPRKRLQTPRQQHSFVLQHEIVVQFRPVMFQNDELRHGTVR